MPEGLIMRCHEKGIPVDSRLDLERMKQRLQLMATWELLPMSELQAECYRSWMAARFMHQLRGFQWNSCVFDGSERW